MPKRGYEYKIERYVRKIRKLEGSRRLMQIVSSSDSEENTENEPQIADEPTPGTSEGLAQASDIPEQVSDNIEQATPDISEQVDLDTPRPEITDLAVESTTIPDLDPDILSALGDTTEDTPKFGEKIHNKLAGLWLPILRKGINKEAKEKLMKQYLVPENCTLLQAPKLNAEISAAICDPTRLKDKRVESVQQQLGQGLTALNRGLSLLLDNDKERVQAIKFLSDSCRILCDLHFIETEARKKFVTPGLDRSFLNVIQDVDRDETLFGAKLSEKIKASKAIEKQGLQIKKSAPFNKVPATPSPHTLSNRPRPHLNWRGPPRFSSSRGGRGGARRAYTAAQRAPQAPAARPQLQAKQRAPAQQ